MDLPSSGGASCGRPHIWPWRFRVVSGSSPSSSVSVQAVSALLVALGSIFALASAWYFQLVIGLAPCPLCLEQRFAYYAGVPVALLAIVLALSGRWGWARVLLGLLALAMAANAALAVYHAGVEWRFWPGPVTCTGVPTVTENVFEALKGARVPRCDEAPWRLFGISMAGWNALIAAGLAVIAGWGAATSRKA